MDELPVISDPAIAHAIEILEAQGARPEIVERVIRAVSRPWTQADEFGLLRERAPEAYAAMVANMQSETWANTRAVEGFLRGQRAAIAFAFATLAAALVVGLITENVALTAVFFGTTLVAVLGALLQGRLRRT